MPDGVNDRYVEVPSELTENRSLLMPYFQTNIVEVHKEELAYNTRDLVADVGGVLGLFLGFNFLMIWDWIVWGIKKVCTNNI